MKIVGSGLRALTWMQWPAWKNLQLPFLCEDCARLLLRLRDGAANGLGVGAVPPLSDRSFGIGIRFALTTYSASSVAISKRFFFYRHTRDFTL